MVVDISGNRIPTHVADVKPGQSVLTLKEGTEVVTEVLSNLRLEGSFQHVHITGALGNRTEDVTVTSNHMIPRMRSPSFFATQAELVAAGSLQPGDSIMVKRPGASEKPALAQVVRLERRILSHKNFLVTMSGTVLANNVLASTVCDADEIAGDSATRFAKESANHTKTNVSMEVELGKWQRDHAAVFSSWHRAATAAAFVV